MATTLKELIEDIEKDDLPTNEFTIEDEDPMVILGKINEVIASLKMIQDTISSSDTKAQEALTTAIQSLETANKALSSSNVSLETANQAIATANQAIASANTALQESQNAVDNSNQANNTANIAGTNAFEALMVAQEALEQVVQGLGTKVYINNAIQDRLDFTEDPQTQINNILSQVETNTSDISTLTADVEELGNELNTTNANLNTEATTRENADNELQQQITSLENNKANLYNGNNFNGTQAFLGNVEFHQPAVTIYGWNGLDNIINNYNYNYTCQYFNCESGTNNAPISDGGICFHKQANGDYACQMFIGNDENCTTWRRNYRAGTWQDWKQMEQIVEKGTNYIRYASGIQICWGRTGSVNNTTITYPVPFKDASSYSCSGVSNGWTGSYGNYGMSNLTATSFYLNSDKAYVWLWLAIGYWK